MANVTLTKIRHGLSALIPLAVGLICSAVGVGMPSGQTPPGVQLWDTVAMPYGLIDSLDNVIDSAYMADSLNTGRLGRSASRHRVSVQKDLSDSTPRATFIREKADLDHVVTFSATDSMVLVGNNDARMYGESKVTYGDIELQANSIEMDTRTSEVYAVGVPDSTGTAVGTPVFKDGDTDYESQTMRYNFKTGKGFITDVITQQGEGYLTGGQTKKVEDNTFYVENGRYTTCDNHEHPHFWLQLTKAKVRPGHDVVSGPAYMVLEGLPLPLAVPFGYFPFSERYASGIIVPTFGDDYRRGFYLSDGGYYFAINDNIDLALTGEIYTKGSWGVRAQSTYNKRYKFNGSFNLSYITTIYGDKGMPDYSKQTNFQVLWNHTQDAKANPNLNFSASVNYTTSGYTRNDLNSYYSNAFTENTKSSTINLTWRPPGSKWSLSANTNITQRTQDSTLAVSFPNITASLSQIQPFKRKNAVGAERWYEKIRLSYTGQFSNSLTARQDQFFHKSLIKDWRNGFKHYLPISATFTAFQYFNITPAITFNDRMYTNKVRRQWDPNLSAEVQDTTYGFYNSFDFNASISIDTKLYGFYKPLPFLGDKVRMIRHVFTPSVSFNGSPDFSDPFWGSYGQLQYTDQNGNLVNRRYSYFPNSLFGVPGQGKTGAVTLSLANNVEMKVRSDNDSVPDRKISLIENLQLQQSYNFAADSLRWSNLNANLLLRLTKNFNLNLSTTWDPYTYALSPSGTPVRVDRTRLQAGKGWVRLSSAGTSFSYTFNNDTFRRNKNKDSKNNTSEAQEFAEETSDFSQRTPQTNRNENNGDMKMDADGYMEWEVPWSLSVNYSIGYAYGRFDVDKMEYKGRVTQNLSFSGNIRPTRNWAFSFSASYNFDTHKLAYMNCNISRDMHCFAMSASFIPVGPYKSYNFHIAIKSSLLSDIKYDKRSSLSNGVTWY